MLKVPSSARSHLYERYYSHNQSNDKHRRADAKEKPPTTLLGAGSPRLSLISMDRREGGIANLDTKPNKSNAVIAPTVVRTAETSRRENTARSLIGHTPLLESSHFSSINVSYCSGAFFCGEASSSIDL